MRLEFGVVDAEFFCLFLNQGRAARELLHQFGRDPRQFPTLFRATDRQAQVAQTTGQSRMKHGLKVGSIPLEVSELARLPGLLFLVMVYVEDEAMSMQMRVRQAVDWSRREVDELTPGHVAGQLVLLFASFADSCLHLGFHVPHCAVDCIPERIEQPFVPRHAV